MTDEIRKNLELVLSAMGGGDPSTGMAQDALRQIVWQLGGNVDVIDQGPPQYAVTYALTLILARG